MVYLQWVDGMDPKKGWSSEQFYDVVSTLRELSYDFILLNTKIIKFIEAELD